MLHTRTLESKHESREVPKDSFQRSEPASISIGAGLLAAVSLLGMSACTPPPNSAQPIPESDSENWN